MPDAKFSDPIYAKRYTNTENCFEVLKSVLVEMFRQVGVLKIDEGGVAYQGLLIRHLVMPNNVAGSKRILKFIAENLSTNNYVNIMSQYRPYFKAENEPLINRPINYTEYQQVIKFAKELGLSRGF